MIEYLRMREQAPEPCDAMVHAKFKKVGKGYIEDYVSEACISCPIRCELHGQKFTSKVGKDFNLLETDARAQARNVLLGCGGPSKLEKK